MFRQTLELPFSAPAVLAGVAQAAPV